MESVIAIDENNADYSLFQKLLDGKLDKKSVVKTLYKKYNFRLYGSLYRRSNEKTFASDSASIVWAKIFSNLDTLALKIVSGHYQFKTLMFMIGQRVMTNELSRMENRNCSLDEIVEDRCAWDYVDSDSTIEYAEILQVLECFESILNLLTHVKKEAYVMKCKGYSYKEIADHQCVPTGTVHARIKSARALIRKRFFGYGMKLDKYSGDNIV